MKYSYIIPVYNRDVYIIQVLESICLQHRSDFEVIIVDDGSSDNTRDVVEEFISENDNVHYFYQSNGGVSSARNFGAKVSRGEFLIFVDSDDKVKAEQLNIFDNAMTKYSKCNVYFTSYEFWDSERDVYIPRAEIKEGLYREFLTDFVRGIQPFLVGGLCIDRNVFLNSRQFVVGEQFGEDQNLWIDIICDNTSISIPIVSHFYRVDSNASLSKKRISKLPPDMNNILERLNSNNHYNVSSESMKAYINLRIKSFIKIALRNRDFNLLYEIFIFSKKYFINSKCR